MSSDADSGGSAALDAGAQLQVDAARDLLRRLPELLATTDGYAAEAAREGNRRECDHWLELRLSWSLLGRQAERVLDELAS